VYLLCGDFQNVFTNDAIFSMSFIAPFVGVVVSKQGIYLVPMEKEK
jgi:hypothetical protein